VARWEQKAPEGAESLRHGNNQRKEGNYNGPNLGRNRLGGVPRAGSRQSVGGRRGVKKNKGAEPLNRESKFITEKGLHKKASAVFQKKNHSCPNNEAGAGGRTHAPTK